MSVATLAPRRPDVARSWVRSRMCGLERTGPIVVPYVEPGEVDSRFVRAATPVVRRLAAQLAGCDTAVVLTDPEGTVVLREVDDISLRRRLDRGCSASGFVWAEEFSGATALSIALEERVPAYCVGDDHYLLALRDLTCAAAPVVNPLTGRLEGVLALTTLTGGSDKLMLPMVMQAARGIEEALIAVGSVDERELLDRFLAASRQPGVAVAVLGRNAEMLSPKASDLLSRSDRARLRQRADDLTVGRAEKRDHVPLDGGRGAEARFQGIEVGGRFVGTLIELRVDDVVRRPGSRTAPRAEEAPALDLIPVGGGLAGRSDAVSLVRDQAARLRDSRVPVVVSGEPGVGKLTLARQLVPTGAPVVHLDAGSAAAGSEAGVLAELEALVRGGGRVALVRHVGALSAGGLRRLGELADAVQGSGGRVLCTYTVPLDPSEPPPFGVRLHVPALRERPEDALELVPELLADHPGKVSASGALMRALMRYPWPGNVRELESVLAALVASASGPVLGLADLPPHYQRGSRRLRRIEQVERVAIVQALQESHGNKTRAAELLEIGRATLYRKMRVYGLEPGGAQ